MRVIDESTHSFNGTAGSKDPLIVARVEFVYRSMNGIFMNPAFHDERARVRALSHRQKRINTVECRSGYPNHHQEGQDPSFPRKSPSLFAVQKPEESALPNLARSADWCDATRARFVDFRYLVHGVQ